MDVTSTMPSLMPRAWPPGAAIPYWVYSGPAVYAAEIERIWYGPHWLYAGLEAEIPNVVISKPQRLANAQSL